jgi:hypothetical protein
MGLPGGIAALRDPRYTIAALHDRRAARSSLHGV